MITISDFVFKYFFIYLSMNAVRLYRHIHVRIHLFEQFCFRFIFFLNYQQRKDRLLSQKHILFFGLSSSNLQSYMYLCMNDTFLLIYINSSLRNQHPPQQMKNEKTFFDLIMETPGFSKRGTESMPAFMQMDILMYQMQFLRNTNIEYLEYISNLQ